MSALDRAEHAAALVVLIVDDDPLVREAYGRMLERHGHVVLHATGAAHALRVLEQTHVDAVVADLEMPDVDGVRLLSQVRKSHPRCARVLLTACPSGELAAHDIAAANVHAILYKGMKPQEICVEIERIGRDRQH